MCVLVQMEILDSVTGVHWATFGMQLPIPVEVCASVLLAQQNALGL